MGLDWFTAEHLSAEWVVLTAAPLLTLGLILAMLALGYAGARWVFGAKIEHLNSRLSLRDDEIANYKRKLDGATPDEAKARLDALESKIVTLEAAIEAERDENELFQNGKSVGSATEPVEEGATVKFTAIFGGEHFDLDREIEWRGFALKATTYDPPFRYDTMGVRGMNVERVTCEIVRRP